MKQKSQTEVDAMNQKTETSISNFSDLPEIRSSIRRLDCSTWLGRVGAAISLALTLVAVWFVSTGKVSEGAITTGMSGLAISIQLFQLANDANDRRPDKVVEERKDDA